jgi:excisionase family DNA binding protein
MLRMTLRSGDVPRGMTEPVGTQGLRRAPLVLTPDEAAEELKISPRKLYDLLAGREPKIRSVRIGKLRRIPYSALEAFIDAELAAADTVGEDQYSLSTSGEVAQRRRGGAPPEAQSGPRVSVDHRGADPRAEDRPRRNRR